MHLIGPDSKLTLHFPVDDFNLPKLHALLHYVEYIKDFGTLDNCNTETTERLHIDCAKEACRASNKKEIVDQMVHWMVRVEKIETHVLHVQFREGIVPPPEKAPTRLQLTKNPSAPSVTLSALASSYHAPTFLTCLKTFLERYAPTQPAHRRQSVLNRIRDLQTASLAVPAFHRVRIILSPTQDVDGIADRTDAVHVRPARKNKQGEITRSKRFDTILVDGHGDAGDTTLDSQCTMLLVLAKSLTSRVGLRPTSWAGPHCLQATRRHPRKHLRLTSSSDRSPRPRPLVQPPSLPTGQAPQYVSYHSLYRQLPARIRHCRACVYPPFLPSLYSLSTGGNLGVGSQELDKRQRPGAMWRLSHQQFR